jgi:hypothetical protein
MAESIEERRIWDLLVRDFYWRVPSDFLVKVLGRSQSASLGPVRLQVFEIAVAAIFAHLRPEYEWYVTPDLPDGGLDFVGEGRFLEDAELGIAAAITVGGQCKKRSRVTDVVAEISGSLARMSDRINPTFFLVALSARLSHKRISEARRILEATHRRHCHILDRGQIEGLICDHLVVIDPILRKGLSDAETRAVLNYFEKRAPAASQDALDFSAPARVLAGEPFRIPLTFRSPRLALRGMRLWWKPVPDRANAVSHSSVILVGPVGADADPGAECVAKSIADDPLIAQMSVELVSYAVGRVDLGEVCVGRQPDVAAGRATTVRLGQVQVVENIRPRFFERPFRAALTKLSMEYDRALARGVACAAILGAGGNGKSRLCEEFSLEKRRRGCHVVQARQSKTLDDPHRLLTDLLIGLAETGVTFSDPADAVIGAIEQYDRNLAGQAAPAIRSIVGIQDGLPTTATDQALLSALLLLIIVRIRSAPLIIHLQDLHWCSADILLLLERLAWQLEMICKSENSAAAQSASGVLFLFEGRISESQGVGPKLWSTRMFEAFIEKLGCPTVTCVPFNPGESLEFVRRLFEERHSAGRLIDASLLELQASLAELIERTAGGNPFHTLAQIQLLKEHRILAQNPETGLLYMIQPATDVVMLPRTVFESIKLRWQYLKACKPRLATLLWAASRLEDRIPSPLFRYLWREIGPDLSMGDIDATEFLWTGSREQAEVSFRHENYFHSLRRLELASDEHERVVEIYARWFSKFRKLDAVDQFRWARILIDSPGPDARKVRSLLGTALASARRRGDLTLACRVQTTLLDFIWMENSRSMIAMSAFLSRCDQEVTLCRSLLTSDRLQAGERIDNLLGRLRERLSVSGVGSSVAAGKLQLRLLTADILKSQILFNDRQPARASEVAAEAVRNIRANFSAASIREQLTWRTLEMEALHANAVALALGGEIEAAIDASERAVRIAREMPTPLSLDVMSTHANILLSQGLEAPEFILSECFARASSQQASRETQDAIAINLGMTYILGAYRSRVSDQHASEKKLVDAASLLRPVFANAFRIGRYPDAAATALLLGIISALRNEGDEVSWFAQAVTAAARGAQMETLWRSHINLATALHRRNPNAAETVRDHARSALEILEETLSPYPHPDRSTRFEWVRIPLAQAVRFLIQLGDERGLSTLERYPSLRSCFHDPERGILHADRGGYRNHEWLQLGELDYVIY